jgi:hypothetical protein
LKTEDGISEEVVSDPTGTHFLIQYLIVSTMPTLRLIYLTEQYTGVTEDETNNKTAAVELHSPLHHDVFMNKVDSRLTMQQEMPRRTTKNLQQSEERR